jgi:4-diphosphocytidyl-2-C-methyl-D-erythritol kinase
MRALYDVPAPAKLNLFLHIVGRRDDGYHLLQSAFTLLDWQDTLHLELRPGGALSREDIGEPVPADDLILRAARALQQATGTTHGVHVTLDKRLPAQAGLGGGSSDAASTLLALNRLWRTGLPLGALEHIGLKLGADLPFFLRGRNAWVEGIGEQITPIALPPARFAVLKPPQGLNTAEIFSDPALVRSSEAAILSGFAAVPPGALYDFGSNLEDYDSGRNALQPVAQRLCPGVTQALQWLGAQGLKPRMTGSGSAVFALLPEGASLSGPPDGFELRICGNMAEHPLVGWAASDS